MGKVARIFGTLIFGSGIGAAGFYVYDPKEFEKTLKSLQSQILQQTGLLSSAKSKLNNSSSSSSSPAHTHTQGAAHPEGAGAKKGKKESEVKAMEVKLREAFSADMEKLRQETEWLAENFEKQLEVSKLTGFKQLDLVATAFQQELEKERAGVEKLKVAHVEQLKLIREEFDRMVEVKVDEQTRFRLTQLHSLGAIVERLRGSTTEFTQFASLHLYTLHLVRLLNTLPHNQHSLDDSLTTRNDLLLLADPFVKTVLDQMPNDVESNESLSASFSRLKPRLKQLSLVPKDGGLFSLVISRILSPFMFNYQTKVESVDSLLSEGNLFDALDELVELNNEGWNSLVLTDFVERVRKRAEFELGLGALTAHLGLISTCSIIPQIQLSSSSDDQQQQQIVKQTN